MAEVRIVRGHPTDEELAALISVLFLRGVPAAAYPGKRRSWTASARPGGTHSDGRPTRPGRGAWRASAQPR